MLVEGGDGPADLLQPQLTEDRRTSVQFPIAVALDFELGVVKEVEGLSAVLARGEQDMANYGTRRQPSFTPARTS